MESSVTAASADSVAFIAVWLMLVKTFPKLSLASDFLRIGFNFSDKRPTKYGEPEMSKRNEFYN